MVYDVIQHHRDILLCDIIIPVMNVVGHCTVSCTIGVLALTFTVTNGHGTQI